MVVIRLSRGGAHKRPFYKVVVADSRAARDCRYIEHVGFFNPIAVGGEQRLELNREQINYWIANGAKPSLRVESLIREADHPEILEKRAAHHEAVKAKRAAKAAAAAKETAEAAA